MLAEKALLIYGSGKSLNDIRRFIGQFFNLRLITISVSVVGANIVFKAICFLKLLLSSARTIQALSSTKGRLNHEHF